MISFQGVPGAYSDLACRNAFPEMETLPCASFQDAIDAVREGRAARRNPDRRHNRKARPRPQQRAIS